MIFVQAYLYGDVLRSKSVEWIWDAGDAPLVWREEVPLIENNTHTQKYGFIFIRMLVIILFFILYRLWHSSRSIHGIRLSARYGTYNLLWEFFKRRLSEYLSSRVVLLGACLWMWRVIGMRLFSINRAMTCTGWSGGFHNHYRTSTNCLHLYWSLVDGVQSLETVVSSTPTFGIMVVLSKWELLNALFRYDSHFHFSLSSL